VSESIPFNRPHLGGSELTYARQAIEGLKISSNGDFTRRCEELLADALEVPRVMLTTSCTSALEMTALLLDLRPGDEVVMPSFTFVSTANAYRLRGVKLVFVDIRPDTLNLDETALEALLTPASRAIVPVHYGGIACAMDEICSLARARGVRVIEDNAHGLFARYKGRPLGSLGDLAAQSFHDTKNFSCGEGGALVIGNPEFIERAEIIREMGTDRSRFFRGEIDKYTWVEVGTNCLPSDLLAPVLFAQLEERESVQRARRAIWDRYATGLADWAQSNGARLPHVPDACEHSAHLFHLVMPSEASRRALIEQLRANDIQAVFHFQPLHLSAVGRALGYAPGDLPITEEVAGRLVRLPFYTDLAEAEQERVIGEILQLEPL